MIKKTFQDAEIRVFPENTQTKAENTSDSRRFIPNGRRLWCLADVARAQRLRWTMGLSLRRMLQRRDTGDRGVE